MKLSEINLNSETLSGFFKKYWMLILSFAAGIAIIGAFAWSFLFLLQAVNKSVHYDELRVSGETKGIDMDSYNRLKDKWKDFQGGKYIAPAGNSVSVQININALNANSANANSANENANTAANANGNVNAAVNNNTSDMNTNQ